MQFFLLGALLGTLYYSILNSLVRQWHEDPNYSHGFLVLPFSAWVIYRRRHQLRNLPLAQEGWGLFVTICGLGILAVGVLGAENFLSRISLLIVLAGVAIQFRGWPFFRAVLFPWAALFLMIPLPAVVFNQIALPLQFLAARLGTSLLYLVGVPVLREGNIINLPYLSLDVAEACSGLRSLMTLITLGIFYGYFQESGPWRRSLLILSSIPIAIAANGLRIMGAGLVGEYWSPDKAEGFFHTFSGIAIFAVSCGLLVLVHGTLTWIHRRARPGLVT
jgi:exosortase